MYDKLQAIGDSVLLGGSEPFQHFDVDGTWLVHVDTPLGCRSVRCDWLEAA
jgi:hypothetical protein